MKARKNILLALFFLVTGISSFAQPSNDDCANAITLDASSSTCTATNADNISATASGETPSPTCGSFSSGVDVWFKFVAPAAGDVEITTTSGTVSDMAMNLYSGSCGSLTNIECDDDDGPGTMPEISRTDLTGGNTYYIRMWEYGSNATGTFTICVKDIGPPDNDVICSAVSVAVNSGCTSGSNTSSTSSGDPSPSCYSTSHSVWYSFVATDDSMTVSTDFTGDAFDLTDTEVSVYSSSDNTCSGSLTQVGCDDDGGIGSSNTSIVTMTGLTVSDTYFVLVDGEGSNTGTFCLSVYKQNPKTVVYGESCGNPKVMHPHTSCSSNYGNSVDVDAAGFGNSEGVNGSCGDNDSSQDVFWAQFTANSTSTTVSNYSGGTVDMTLFTGSCGSLTEADCAGSIGSFSSNNFTTVNGTTYLVMISNNGGSNTNRDICITSTAACTAPLNDDCADAMTITLDQGYTLTNACATSDEDLCSGNTENNVWMSWTAPADWGAFEIAFLNIANQDCNDANDGSGVQLSVYNAGTTCATIPASASSSDCIVYNNPAADDNFYANFVAVANSTYLINVDGYAGDACDFSFQLNNDAPVFLPLPIELTNFEGIAKDEGVELNWITRSEINNDYVILQRSKLGVVFEDVAVLNGYGTSNERHDYTYTDVDSYDGTSFYRLMQFDYNGSYRLSTIISVKAASDPIDFHVFPNPNAGEFSIDFATTTSNKNSTISVIDVTGKHVYEQGITNFDQRVSLSLTHLPKGMYTVIVSNEYNRVPRRLIIQ